MQKAAIAVVGDRILSRQGRTVTIFGSVTDKKGTHHFVERTFSFPFVSRAKAYLGQFTSTKKIRD